jgi:hypothetical protein
MECEAVRNRNLLWPQLKVLLPPAVDKSRYPLWPIDSSLHDAKMSPGAFLSLIAPVTSDGVAGRHAAMLGVDRDSEANPLLRFML